MHSVGLELTKLTYTRLEDNLLRHRGDRPLYTTTVTPKIESARISNRYSISQLECIFIFNDNKQHQADDIK